MAGVDSAYEFNDLDQPVGISKFFLKSPASCQTPVRSEGNDSKLLQREEVWEKYLRKRNPKRDRTSPEYENGRNGKKPSLK